MPRYSQSQNSVRLEIFDNVSNNTLQAVRLSKTIQEWIQGLEDERERTGSARSTIDPKTSDLPTCIEELHNYCCEIGMRGGSRCTPMFRPDESTIKERPGLWYDYIVEDIHGALIARGYDKVILADKSYHSWHDAARDSLDRYRDTLYQAACGRGMWEITFPEARYNASHFRREGLWGIREVVDSCPSLEGVNWNDLIIDIEREQRIVRDYILSTPELEPETETSTLVVKANQGTKTNITATQADALLEDLLKKPGPGKNGTWTKRPAQRAIGFLSSKFNELPVWVSYLKWKNENHKTRNLGPRIGRTGIDQVVGKVADEKSHDPSEMTVAKSVLEQHGGDLNAALAAVQREQRERALSELIATQKTGGIAGLR